MTTDLKPSPELVAQLDALVIEEPQEVKGRFAAEMFWRGVNATKDAIKAAEWGAQQVSGDASLPTSYYGIIDPKYAAAFTEIRLTAWQYGWAIAMHGSFTRDLDLIAVPWTASACEPEKLIQQILYRTKMRDAHGKFANKPHGRLVWTLMFPEFDDPRFIDLSLIPLYTSAQQRGVVIPIEDAELIVADGLQPTQEQIAAIKERLKVAIAAAKGDNNADG